MKAMVLKRLCNLTDNRTPLELMELPVPVPGEKEILLKVSACGVCHTELDEIEGRTPPSQLPIVPGHQVVGRVEAVGSKVSTIQIGNRVGVAWIFSACGACKFCLTGNENLCQSFEATGRDANGGYAQYMIACRKFRLCNSGGFFRRTSCTFALCRSNRLSIATINGAKRRTTSGFDRLWRIRSSGFKDGQIQVSKYRSLCFCPKRRRKIICHGTGRCLGRKYH